MILFSISVVRVLPNSVYDDATHVPTQVKKITTCTPF